MVALYTGTFMYVGEIKHFYVPRNSQTRRGSKEEESIVQRGLKYTIIFEGGAV